MGDIAMAWVCGSYMEGGGGGGGGIHTHAVTHACTVALTH